MILCLGEAIVDLVCERELDSPAEADEFRPRFGGALANVAVSAARCGAEPGLAGGVGDDPFGHWLTDALTAEGVGLGFFSHLSGVRTPISVITFDRAREPHFEVYDEGVAETICSVESRLDTAIEAADALVFGSNTLVGQRERDLTMRARVLAIERGLPVLFDPNLRAGRWDDLDRARELCLAAIDGAYCVRANAAEAVWLAGLGDDVPSEEAAEALASRGARVAVVTRGPDGAVARGAGSGDVAGEEVEVVSPLGAGDAFFGALIAGYANRGWDTAATPEVLAEANRAGAGACTVWRAVR